MYLIKNKVYKHKDTGWYLRLLSTENSHCYLQSDSGKWSWSGNVATFMMEFEETDLFFAGIIERVGPSEFKG